jgi:uncharacterized protein (TIGR02001 family)
MVRGNARTKGEGQVMKRAVILATALAAFSPTSVLAADMAVKAPPPAAPASPWDLAFGAAIMNDYIFRGITQSDHKPSVAEYQELRYNFNPNLQAYLGLSGESIDFPNHAAAEVDFYGGIRPTVGPVAFDLGVWYYYYPGGQCFGIGADCTEPSLPNGNVIKSDLSFWEYYGKATWTVNDSLAVGVNEFYDPDWLNSGAWGNYFSGIAKYTLPSTVHLPFGAGAYISGEFGHYWFGTPDAFYAVPVIFPSGTAYPGYNTWNFGLGFTYKVFTLDLRYYDTDLSKVNCNILTSDQTSNGLESTWCGPSFVAKFSFDLTLGSLK